MKISLYFCFLFATNEPFEKNASFNRKFSDAKYLKINISDKKILAFKNHVKRIPICI